MKACKLCVMRVYHRTISKAAQQILVNGFRDAVGTYMTEDQWRGVWASDRALDENEGACGDTLLAMDVPAHVFDEYEWKEDVAKSYRESLIPAAILNAFRRPTVVTEEQE